MVEWDNYYPDGDDDLDQEEPNEFERRKQSAKRESAKRQRADQKYARQEQIESEISRKGHSTDRRFLEKDTKRKYSDLRRLADNLNIKQTLQDISRHASYNCWGPDVVSDKSRPSLGIVLNYTTTKPVPALQPLKINLFGAWLYYADGRSNQVSVVVGTKELAEDSNQMERARIPDKQQIVAVLPYIEAEHDSIESQLAQVLKDWVPAK